MRPSVTLRDVQQARGAIAHLALRTPVLSARSLGQLAGCELLLKAENLQRAGSFKVRGAANKVAALTADQKERGVIAASAGNHAQGVALAAATLGIGCTVVMPTGASLPKVEATRNYGATVLLQGDDFDQSQRYARRVMRENALTFIHAFDDPAIVAGQGTIGLELLEQVEGLDTVVVPVGGGGLISGIALAMKESSPGIRVVGVQAEAATAVVDSYKANQRIAARKQETVADGIAVGTPGRITLPAGLTLRRRHGRGPGGRDHASHDPPPGARQAAGGRRRRVVGTCRRPGSAGSTWPAGVWRWCSAAATSTRT